MACKRTASLVPPQRQLYKTVSWFSTTVYLLIYVTDSFNFTPYLKKPLKKHSSIRTWRKKSTGDTERDHSSSTEILTPRCRVLLEKLTGLQLVKKFPAFHGTPRFITELTSVRHMSLSKASPIQSIYPHPTSCRSILILSTHLRLGLPRGLFPSGFPTKTLYTTLSSPIRATCPAHLILLDFITRIILGEEYKSFSSSLCSHLHSPVTSSLLTTSKVTAGQCATLP